MFQLTMTIDTSHMSHVERTGRSSIPTLRCKSHMSYSQPATPWTGMTPHTSDTHVQHRPCPVNASS